jgi:hypothetical protein
MAVRKTESRIPANFQASDLGQAVVAPDGRCALVSFTTAPIAVERNNTYVLFVTDSALAGAVESCEWTIVENERDPLVVNTLRGILTYFPASVGSLIINVAMLDAGGIAQATLSLAQEVVDPSADAEALIDTASNAPGAGAGNPEVLRELVNEHARYYQAVTPRAPEAADGLRRLLFSFVWDGAQRRTQQARAWQIERLATALNEQPADFAPLAADGVGVSDLRLGLIAMTLLATAGGAPHLLWTELPEPISPRAFADEQLRVAVSALSEPARIDLFNVARFPKSNINQCARVLEELRDRYFPGTSFEDVLTGMSGTRAHWITRHYREGPLKRIGG